MCTLCGDSKYNDLTGQISEADCKNCPGVTNVARTLCSQKKVYQEKTSGQCSNPSTGLSSIMSETQCNQAAVGLGWSDVVGLVTNLNSNYPPGCVQVLTMKPGYNLYYNTLTTSTASCSSTHNCACSLTCRPGTFQNEGDQTTCKSCTAGFYQDASGKPECQTCSTGMYSIQGASSCDFTATTCPEGTYPSGKAACTFCKVGKYNDLEGQTACTICQPGRYQNQNGQSQCKEDCYAGSYINAAQTACLDCEQGQYQNQDWQSTCKDDCNDNGLYINSDQSNCLVNSSSNDAQPAQQTKMQKKVYREQTNGQCSNLGDGWDSIMSIAECEQAAVGLGWSDDVIDKNQFLSIKSESPPGCFLDSKSGIMNINLVFNTLTTSTTSCSSSEKCACSILCPPGTYQDEQDQTSCCPRGMYATGTAGCASITDLFNLLIAVKVLWFVFLGL